MYVGNALMAIGMILLFAVLCYGDRRRIVSEIGRLSWQHLLVKQY